MHAIWFSCHSISPNFMILVKYLKGSWHFKICNQYFNVPWSSLIMLIKVFLALCLKDPFLRGRSFNRHCYNWLLMHVSKCYENIMHIKLSFTNKELWNYLLMVCDAAAVKSNTTNSFICQQKFLCKLSITQYLYKTICSQMPRISI